MHIGVGPLAGKGMLAGVLRESSRLWATAWRPTLVPRRSQGAMASGCRASGAACMAGAVCADL